LIGSAVFAGHMFMTNTDRQTDRQTDKTCYVKTPVATTHI